MKPILCLGEIALLRRNYHLITKHGRKARNLLSQKPMRWISGIRFSLGSVGTKIFPDVSLLMDSIGTKFSTKVKRNGFLTRLR